MRRQVAGRSHAGARKDVMMHVVVVTVPADHLDDAAEQDVSIVAVVERSCRSDQTSLAEQLDIVLQRFQLETMQVERRAENFAGTARVCQQLMNRYSSEFAAGVVRRPR